MNKVKVKVKDKDHLKEIIKKEIELNGNECNLNHLDISNIDDLRYIFYQSTFNGNISKWDVSNVENMESLFEGSKFNGNISGWDVSKVKNMNSMFSKSEFNGCLNRWDVNNIRYLSNLFEESKFERYEDLNNWKPYNLEYNYIFDNKEKEKKVYWSSYNINLLIEDIKDSIDKYWAKKEKEFLLNQNENVDLISKKEKFKI